MCVLNFIICFTTDLIKTNQNLSLKNFFLDNKINFTLSTIVVLITSIYYFNKISS